MEYMWRYYLIFSFDLFIYFSLTLRIFHTPHFPHSACSTLRIFYTPHLPHSAFSTLLIFHTPHSALRVLHLTTNTLRFPHYALRTPRFPLNAFKASLRTGNFTLSTFITSRRLYNAKDINNKKGKDKSRYRDPKDEGKCKRREHSVTNASSWVTINFFTARDTFEEGHVRVTNSTTNRYIEVFYEPFA